MTDPKRELPADPEDADIPESPNAGELEADVTISHEALIAPAPAPADGDAGVPSD